MGGRGGFGIMLLHDVDHVTVGALGLLGLVIFGGPSQTRQGSILVASMNQE